MYDALYNTSAFFNFRDDHDCEDDILPVRTIQQVESYLLSAVAVLKSYMTTGVRVTATEILALMSQVQTAVFCRRVRPPSAVRPTFPQYVGRCWGFY